MWTMHASAREHVNNLTPQTCGLGRCRYKGPTDPTPSVRSSATTIQARNTTTMTTLDSYVLTLGEGAGGVTTVTRDGPTAPFDVVGPLVWRLTVDGVPKLQRNAMGELTMNYKMVPGAYEAWLEKQERSEDGALKCTCVSNKLSFAVKKPVALNPDPNPYPNPYPNQARQGDLR